MLQKGHLPKYVVFWGYVYEDALLVFHLSLLPQAEMCHLSHVIDLMDNDQDPWARLLGMVRDYEDIESYLANRGRVAGHLLWTLLGEGARLLIVRDGDA